MRRSYIFATFLGACAGAASLASCSGNTNPAILPITAVDIDIADLLNGANLGCGNGDFDVYRYAAIVALDDPDAAVEPISGERCIPNAMGTVSNGIAACFAPAVFSNLPLLPDGGALPDGGSVEYSVKVFFYNKTTYNKFGDEIEEAVTPDAGTNVKTLCDIPATWTTQCTAVEQGNIAVNAFCKPLVAGSQAPRADAGASDAKTDATVKDAGEEALPDASPDAPSDDDVDAGALSDAAAG